MKQKYKLEMSQTGKFVLQASRKSRNETEIQT